MISESPQDLVDRSTAVAADRGRHVFSVDVEDYFQVSAFEQHVDRSDWTNYESRVVANTRRILDLVDRQGITATFYVLGWVADQCPELVREIDDRGHEIGTHSYWHRLVYQQTPDEFREDLRRSMDVLSSIIDKPIFAYRAPSFSITRKSLWALEILVEEGIRVDSSIVPARHDRYGIPGSQRGLHELKTPAGTLSEFPPTVVRLARWDLPVGGGGYFRLYPLGFTRECWRRAARQMDSPLMFYIHPWEVDPDQPRLRVASRTARFRHYVNLHKTERKLVEFMNSFRFGTLSQAVPFA